MDAGSPIRDAIRRRLDQGSLTARDASRMLGCYRQTVGNFLTGKKGMSINTLERLCEILDLTLQPAPKKANRSKHGSNLGHDHNIYKDGS